MPGPLSAQLQQRLAQAMAALQASDWDAVERLSRLVLDEAPDQPHALHFLGMALSARGDKMTAAGLMERSIEFLPTEVQFYNNLGEIYRSVERFDRAENCFNRALQINPKYAPAYNNLGLTLQATGVPSQAVNAFCRAIEQDPGVPQFHYNLGLSLAWMGQTMEAIACYRHAVQLKGDYVNALAALGQGLTHEGQVDEGREFLRRAVEHGSDDPAVFCSIAGALVSIRQNEQALAFAKGAIERRPIFAPAHANLAGAYLGLHKPVEAAAAARTAVEQDPRMDMAWSNLGNALLQLGQIDEALAAYDQGLAINPDRHEIHFNRSIILLLKGDFEQGWIEHEHRPSQRKPLTQPEWDGLELRGKSLLVHCEQGLGDTIQFSRFLPMALGRAGKIIFECQPQVIGLMRRSFPDVETIPTGAASLPPFEAQIRLLSLARILNITSATIPATVPYLRPDPARIERWRQWLDQADPSRAKRIGLAWAGNPQHFNDANRSISLTALAPLAQVGGVAFVSLQKGAPAEEADHPPAGMRLLRADRELNDLDDTAGLMSALDLVICVDTSVAHLAGALGLAVWTLIPHNPDWRWRLETTQSAWYPTMRLWRQSQRQDWKRVIEAIARELKKTVNRRRR